jgi:acetyl esterase/lipase
VGQKIASLGHDCIMAGYRKSPKWRFDTIIEDVFEGYVKIREYLEKAGRSYDKIIISGSSAGAHLAALLCFDEEKKASYGISENEFAGLILMAGPVDFSQPQTKTLNKLLTRLFNTKDRNIWKTGEPILKMTAVPGLKVRIIQSRHDGLVGFEQARDLHEKALSLGMNSEFYEVKDPWDTHSLYCVGVFLLEPSRSETLRKVARMIEDI